MKKLPKRSKEVKRHKRVIERYHKEKVALAYTEYYKEAVF